MFKTLVKNISRLFSRSAIRNELQIPDGLRNMWDWIMAPSHPDKELQRDFLKRRSHARELSRTNPLVMQYLALLKNNVIGHRGMKLQAQVRNSAGELNKNINDKIESAWNEFWKSPFIDQRLTGVAGEQLLLETLATDGEVFVRKCIGAQLNKFGFALQIIDSALVDHDLNQPAANGKNEIRLGIEVDALNRAVGIWVWDNYPDSGLSRKRNFIPAKEIIHIFIPDRINQTRGVTWFNNVMTTLKMLDGFMEARLVASRTAACAFPVFTQPDMDPTLSVNKNANAAYSLELSPGSGLTLPTGMSMESWNPNQPSDNVAEYVKVLSRWCSSGFRFPVSYNALANDLENVNYSSMRSGLLIERDGWRVLQQFWIDMFRIPVSEAWLPCAMLSGALVLDSRDSRKFMALAWYPRGWAWVDPKKDMEAAILALGAKLTTRSKIVSEAGEDIEDIFEALQKEDALAEQYGIVFNQEPLATTLARSLAAPDDENMTPEEKQADQQRTKALLSLHRGGK